MATTLFVILMMMISFGANSPMMAAIKGKNISKKIEIEIKDNTILNFKSINPVTKEVTIVK